MIRSHRAAWGALALVLVGLLAFGARSSSPDDEDRLFSIAGQMKCMACSGETVAGSQAPLAIEMRSLIRRQIDDGRSDDQIFTYFAGRYGEQVLLRPSSSGLTGLVWVLPVVAGAAAAAGLGLVLARWRRVAVAEVPATDADRALVEAARRGDTE